MISYGKLWKLLEEKNISQYKLINEYGFSTRTIHKLKYDKVITSGTIERLCDILECQPGDLMENIQNDSINAK